MEGLRFSFNTGRGYSPGGQKIVVEVSDGRIWFHDTTRHIAGSTPYTEWSPFGERSVSAIMADVRADVMTVYDHGGYHGEQVPRLPTLARHREGREALAWEVKMILAHAKLKDKMGSDDDAVALPLMQLLHIEDILPDPKAAFLEWQGAWEHNVAAVFFGKAGEHCLNVGPDGTVTVYA